MTVKHQPYTALPWHVLEDGRPRVKLAHIETPCDHPVEAGLPVCSINTARIGDANYIVHAAMAYPRLVEELQRLCVEIPKQLGSNKPMSNGLLRELGEQGD